MRQSWCCRFRVGRVGDDFDLHHDNAAPYGIWSDGTGVGNPATMISTGDAPIMAMALKSGGAIKGTRLPTTCRRTARKRATSRRPTGTPGLRLARLPGGLPG